MRGERVFQKAKGARTKRRTAMMLALRAKNFDAALALLEPLFQVMIPPSTKHVLLTTTLHPAPYDTCVCPSLPPSHTPPSSPPMRSQVEPGLAP